MDHFDKFICLWFSGAWLKYLLAFLCGAAFIHFGFLVGEPRDISIGLMIFLPLIGVMLLVRRLQEGEW